MPEDLLSLINLEKERYLLFSHEKHQLKKYELDEIEDYWKC
jgi:hypothetical protein